MIYRSLDKTGKNQKQGFLAGFTLMEMIVVLGIFSVATLIITDTFMLGLKANRKAALYQKTESEIRMVTEEITKAARTKTINYNYYGGSITNPVDNLALVDLDDINKIYFKKDVDFVALSDDGLVWTNLTSSQVVVKALRFYLNPTTDPFLVNGPNVQPKITVVLEIESKEGRPEEKADIVLQTTVSSRVYKR